MLNRILVACVGIPIILVALFVLPSIFTPILIGVLSVVGTYEALHAIKMNHPRIALYTMLLALAVPFWVYFGEIRHWALLALIIYLILVFLEAFFSGFRVRIERVGSGFFFALLISYCLSSVVSLGNLELRTSYVLLPIALPFVADAAAMITGMFLGRHQLTPQLSPKKTVEGAIGGLVGLWIPSSTPLVRVLCMIAILIALLGILVIIFIRNPRRARARKARREKEKARRDMADPEDKEK